MTRPISSSSITPVPFDLTGFFSDWDDVIGGLFMLMKNFDRVTARAGATLSDFIRTAGEPILNRFVWWPSAKELRIGFGRSLGAGRRVLFERAQPNEQWLPTSLKAQDKDGRIRLSVADFRHGGRVAPEGQEIGQQLFGKDVPWICLAARTQFSKNRAKAQFAHSLFPSHAVFVGTPRNARSGSLLRHSATRADMLEDVRSLERATVVTSHPAITKDAIEFIDVERGAVPTMKASLFPDSPLFRSTAIRTQGTQSTGPLAVAASVFGDMTAFEMDLLEPLREGWQFSTTEVFWSDGTATKLPYLAVLLARSTTSDCGSVGWAGHAALLTGRWSGGRELLSCVDNIAISGVYLDEEPIAEVYFCPSFLADRGLGRDPLDRQPEVAACIPIDDVQFAALTKLVIKWSALEKASVAAALFLRDAGAAIGLNVAMLGTREEMASVALKRLVETNVHRFRINGH
ncbi:hypothetical protein ACVWW4_008990 [Bradyrhizobium sp. LB7.1]